MWPYSPYARYIGSYPTPLTQPDAEPDDCPCVCISFNKDWLPFVLGALTQLTLQSTWIVTDAPDFYTKRQRAQQLINLIAEQGYAMNKCGCGCDTPILTRWTEDGILQISTDGGLTWTDSPLSDPRNSSTIFAPQPTLGDANEDKCRAAGNIVNNFTGQIEQYADDLDETSSLIEMIVAVGTAVTVWLGVFAPLATFIAALAGELFAEGATAVRAAFDSDVWDRLRCNLFCHINYDGSVDNAAIQRVKDQIDVDETGITNVLLKQMIDTLGAVGLTNQGRIGHATGNDCDTCACGPCDAPTDNFFEFVLSALDIPDGWTVNGGTQQSNALSYGTAYATTTLEFIHDDGNLNFCSMNLTNSITPTCAGCGVRAQVNIGDFHFHFPVEGGGEILFSQPIVTDRFTMSVFGDDSFGINVHEIHVHTTEIT